MFWLRNKKIILWYALKSCKELKFYAQLSCIKSCLCFLDEDYDSEPSMKKVKMEDDNSQIYIENLLQVLFLI